MNTTTEVVRLTQELLAIDTIDPPGNEEKAAAVIARVLAAEGIIQERYSTT